MPSEQATMTQAERNLATLSEYDFVVVVDRSGSMSTEDCPGGRSRWAYMQETLTTFASDLGKLDADGIDVVMFSSEAEAHQGITADKVASLFSSRPIGSTNLTGALEAALKLAGKSSKKDFVIVFTDGVPDNEASVKALITKAANSLSNDDDLTFLFVQVGRDTGATKFLQNLDDGINAKFDIVDAMTIAEAEKFPTTVDMLIKAIND